VTGLPLPVRELRPFAGRQFRYDFAWPDRLLAVEVDGGVWMKGKHARGAGIQRDCEKSVLGWEAGWRVMRVTPELVESGRALQALEAVLR
jgi:very-short-patch-repair endonuclease